MDSGIGIVGKDFALLVSDSLCSRSLVKQKTDIDKIIEVGNKKILFISGDSGDISNFVDFIQKTVQLYSLKTGHSLSTHSVANFLKQELSKSLRKGGLNINLIIAGYDEFIGVSLFYLDYTGNLQRMNYCIQGYASLFISSTLERNFKCNLNLKNAVSLIMKCILILRKRFVIDNSNFMIKIIDKKGSRVLCSL